MSRRRGAVPRTAAVMIAAAVALLSSGCVYLRLLELKRQLAAFERNFTLETSEGVRLGFLRPVLLTRDIRWLGLKPETVQQTGEIEQWRVRWLKEPAPGVVEKMHYDLALDLTFADEKLTRLAIAEHYFAHVPKQLLVKMLKSVGGGKIDRGERSLQTDVSAVETGGPAPPPKLQSITQLLGEPTARITAGPAEILRYRYVPVTTEPGAGLFDLRLVFDRETGELRRLHGKIPVGNIDLGFGPKPDANTR